MWNYPDTVRALLSGYVRLRPRPFTPLPRLFAEEAARRAGASAAAEEKSTPAWSRQRGLGLFDLSPAVIRPRPQCALCDTFCENTPFQYPVCQLKFCGQLCLRRYTARQEQLRSHPSHRCFKDVYCDLSAAPTRAAAASERRLDELTERLDALDLQLDGLRNPLDAAGAPSAV